MSYDISDKLKIAVTSRALFMLEKENGIFEKEGIAAYERYQIGHEDETLRPGAAFLLIQALLGLNRIERLNRKIEVLIISRNSAEISLRVFRSIRHYGIDIVRGIFTGGGEIAPYLGALKVDLFLTANPADAQAAIDIRIPAATILTGNIPDYRPGGRLDEIRIAFDGDAVLFSEESERIYKERGLAAFAENEQKNAQRPMDEGPFARFLKSLSEIQAQIVGDGPRIRTALITARSAPAHERVVRTLRAWNVRIDEACFLGGISKTEVLRAFGAHIFFDDQKVYTHPAAAAVPSATVPYRTGGAMDELVKQSAQEEQ